MDLVLILCEPIKIKSSPVEASRGAAARSVTVKSQDHTKLKPDPRFIPPLAG